MVDKSKREIGKLQRQITRTNLTQKKRRERIALLKAKQAAKK